MAIKKIYRNDGGETKQANNLYANIDGNSVKLFEEKKAAISSGIAPSFNANNFVTLNTTATRKYYFGQYGNAFYGVSDGSVTAVRGTGKASGKVPYWELVDIDANMNGTSLSSTWGSGTNGQTILNYTNGLKNTYFNSADQIAMKNAGSDINTRDKNSSGTGSITASSAYMWPLSHTQLNANMTLGGALYTGSGGIWTRSYSNNNSSTYQAWYVGNSSGYLAGNASVTSTRSVAPAFNLDLAQVLLGKTAAKDATAESMTYIGTKVSEDLKFLINAGTQKANSFTIDNKGNYSGAVTTTINSGTNYISEIIYDSTGLSIWYGNLEQVSSSSGKIDFYIPDNMLESGTYTMAIFEEEKCGAYKTDYASSPVYFRLIIS